MNKNTDWLDAALEPLKNPSLGHTWPSAKDIGSRAALRQRRRKIGVASSTLAIVVIAALLIALVGFPDTSSQTNGRMSLAMGPGIRSVAGPDGSIRLLASAKKTSPASSQTASELATAEQAFALDLTRQELSYSQGSNVVLSPMSADINLSMLEIAASGPTEREIATALQSDGLSASQNAAAWKALVSSELADGPSGALTLANSLWVQKHLDVKTGFLDTEATDFGNDTYQVAFESPSATKAINTWVDVATAGHISELFAPGELAPKTVVVLANALHLHAAWANTHQFTASTGSFITAGGESLSVPTLTAVDDQLDFAETPSYQAVQIPYANSSLAALVIQPKSATVAAWLARLTSNGLATVVGSLTKGTVDLSMPSLDLTSRPLLNTALSAMGMADAFVSADLTPMLGTSLGSQVAIAQVQQADTLQVNRWGTDAAAATGTSIVPLSDTVAQVIDIDHPYLLLIRDTKTGAILFSSVVNNPAGS